jgi:hypothetical protein
MLARQISTRACELDMLQTGRVCMGFANERLVRLAFQSFVGSRCLAAVGRLPSYANA